ncbi:MAG: UbiD family decarboxylase [Dehalococcoidia bacterium]|nr:UbiD family decarboxylase [Dehalococcoidia bacterium]
MAATDLRGWLKEVGEMGELQVIENVDWNLELGAIAELNLRRQERPALYFKKIKDYPDEYGVVAGSLTNTSRFAHVYNLPRVKTWREMLEIVRVKYGVWQSALDQFPPEEVKDGPILQNIQKGDDVDILKFPTPLWHELDGGRYIGTGCAEITRDRETKEINLGCHRVMIHDKKTVGFHMTPGRHCRVHIDKDQARGERSPIAISIGQHPLIFAAAGSEVPHEPRSEYHFIGAVRQERVKVIREELTGLPIPADAEIVIAGWVPLNKTRKEGPFGEFTGYYSSEDEVDQPIIEIERVYYRDNPIILGAPPNRPPDEYSKMMDIIRSAKLYNDLESAGVPEVKGVWVSDVGRQLLITVAIKQRHAGHARQAALAACPGYTMGRYVIVVDEDIDPTDSDDVLWAMCTRTDPVRDIDIIREMRSIPLDPIVRKPTESYMTSRAIINACKPYEWKERFPKAIKMSKELEEQIRTKWGKTLNI